MKTNAILAITLLLPFLPARAEEPMSVRFENGDQLQGVVSGISGDSLLWNSPAFLKPEAFHLGMVEDITLPYSPDIDLPEGNHIAVLTLTNGDEIRGSLISVTDEEISILTSYAGEMVFRRDMVADLEIEDRPEVLFVGPTGLDGWIQSEEEGWTYDQGQLICDSASTIGRDIGKHDKIRVAFDLSWRESARFRLYLHADSKDIGEWHNGFELICQSQYAYMRKRVTRNGHTDSMPIGSSGVVPEFREKEKVRMEILQDLTTGRVRFILDGRVVADWRDNAQADDKMGPYIHFSSDRSNDTRISRIRITTWDGSIDGEWREARGGFMNLHEPPDEEPETEVDEPGGIKLRNGDRIEGEAVEIKEGKVRLKTSFKEFDLPVSRLRSFALRTAEEAENPELCWKPIRKNGDIRAWFAEGGCITFQLTGFKDGALIGASQTFGEASFKLGAFSRLEFNLYPMDYAAPAP